MKAMYLKPTIIVLNICLEQMIAESMGGLLGDGSTPNSLNLGTAASTEATSGNLSRRSLWDAEETDEDGF